ncbi:VOC family protein [Natrinema sp. SYSU A 869]|uniref:VOC family protein n=1 Tax=Natrinema sp. SYSU A 869 TaxID=2871694 RepID=UPI001CA3A68C|nr:VOC family protein [Natrinema sp. SYSU A 869]
MVERACLGDHYVDHVVIGGSVLDELETAFADVGLVPEYGGEHEHDATHNSLIGFEDGSYIELIAATETGCPDRRTDFIRNDVGPCGWALETTGIESLAEQMRAREVPVAVTDRHERETPNGNQAAWLLAYLGDGEPGTSLPFVIENLTPRNRRITPGQSADQIGVTGIDAAVIGVESLGEASNRYRRAFGLSEPKRDRDEGLGAELAYFPGSAVILAAPLDSGWLDDRVSRYGDLPCCVLLAADQRAFDWFDPMTTTTWFDRRVGWLPIDLPEGRVGIVDG